MLAIGTFTTPPRCEHRNERPKVPRKNSMTFLGAEKRCEDNFLCESTAFEPVGCHGDTENALPKPKGRRPAPSIASARSDMSLGILDYYMNDSPLDGRASTTTSTEVDPAIKSFDFDLPPVINSVKPSPEVSQAISLATALDDDDSRPIIQRAPEPSPIATARPLHSQVYRLMPRTRANGPSRRNRGNTVSSQSSRRRSSSLSIRCQGQLSPIKSDTDTDADDDLSTDKTLFTPTPSCPNGHEHVHCRSFPWQARHARCKISRSEADSSCTSRYQCRSPFPNRIRKDSGVSLPSTDRTKWRAVSNSSSGSTPSSTCKASTRSTTSSVTVAETWPCADSRWSEDTVTFSLPVMTPTSKASMSPSSVVHVEHPSQLFTSPLKIRCVDMEDHHGVKGGVCCGLFHRPGRAKSTNGTKSTMGKGNSTDGIKSDVKINSADGLKSMREEAKSTSGTKPARGDYKKRKEGSSLAAKMRRFLTCS